MALARSRKADPAEMATGRGEDGATVWTGGSPSRARRLPDWARLWRVVAPARKNILPPYVRQPRVGLLNRLLLLLLAVGFCFVYGFAFGLFAPGLMLIFAVPLVVLGLLVVWALPDVGKAPTGLLEGLFLAFVVTMVLWPGYLALSVPGLPRITFLRMIGAPMALSLLVCLSLSPAFRGFLSSTLKNSGPLAKTIMLFGVIQTASIAFSSTKGASLNLYFNMVLSWYATFLISCYSFSKEGRATRFALLIWGTALALGLLGLWEHHLQRLPWVGHIPSFLKIDDPLVDKILAGNTRLRGGGHRVQGPYTTSLAFAEYLALTTPFLLQFVVGRYRLLMRVAAAATIPVVIYATVLSQARTGLLGILISFLTFPLAFALLHARRNRRSLPAMVALLSSPLMAVAGLAIALIVPGIRIRLMGGGVEHFSNQGRVEQWHMGIPKILSHPWGYGLGRAAETLGWYNAAGQVSIDSYPLRLVLDYGFVGIAIYYAYTVIAQIYVARDIWNSDKDDDYNHALLYIACGIAVLSFLLMQINFAQQDNEAVMFIIYGLIVGLRFRAAKARSARAGRASA